MNALEKSDLRLGFIPLNDCALLAVAKDRGYFAEEGLNVSLSRESSWATIRDKVAVGALDGAHMLAPMALATSLGAGSEPSPMCAPLSLNLNGMAITLAQPLAEELRQLDPDGMAQRPRTARPLARLVDARRARGGRTLVFAVVFPYSAHNYLLRYWLAEAGVDPDRDLRIVVVPPPRMAELMKSGDIDGFCVGGPWNAQAVAENAGEILIYGSELWGLAPDKVLGVSAAWAERNPTTLRALVRALLRAADWADAGENRPALAALLAKPVYVGAPEEIIRRAILGAPDRPDELNQDYVIFRRSAANFPWRSHALWFLSQMLRWGHVSPDTDLIAASARIYRADIYRAAAADLGIAAPASDLKIEGINAAPWRLSDNSNIAMIADTFFDGKPFDPQQAGRYAASFAISRVR